MKNLPKYNVNTLAEEQIRGYYKQIGSGGLNLLSIGTSIFEYEKLRKIQPTDEINIQLFDQDILGLDLSELRSLLLSLVNLILLNDPTIKLTNGLDIGKKPDLNLSVKNVDAICLFSGGVDSYCGILKSELTYDSILGLFCAHSDQARIIRIVEDLINNRLQSEQFDFLKAGVPSMGGGGYSQLRGFLYILSAAAWMESYSTDTLIISEVGPTMYQPRLAIFDSVTFTTHPYVLEHAKKIIEIVFKKEIKLHLLFENNTKAEIIAKCNFPEGLKETHSCITQRFGTHEGTCYGCITRRLAFIAAGVQDAEYNKDPIGDITANQNNLMPLLRFNHSLLSEKSKLEFHQLENIEMFDKYDLFERFSLDHFSAIHSLHKSGYRINKYVKKIYDELVDEIGTSKFDERLDFLRTQ